MLPSLSTLADGMLREPAKRCAMPWMMRMGWFAQRKPAQLSGGPFDEATVLRAGDAYERVIDWHLANPEFA